MGSGFSKMKKQARLLEEQMQKAKEEMKNLQVVGESGAGRVKLTFNGEKELLKIEINPECVDKDDVEGLQDLLLEAAKEGYKKLEEKSPSSPMNAMSLLPFGL